MVPEAIIIAMFVDTKKNVGAFQYSGFSEQEKKPEKEVRMFEIPALNFNDKSYVHLIKWHNCQLIEPLITIYLSNEVIMRLIERGRYPMSAL